MHIAGSLEHLVALKQYLGQRFLVALDLSNFGFMLLLTLQSCMSKLFSFCECILPLTATKPSALGLQDRCEWGTGKTSHRCKLQMSVSHLTVFLYVNLPSRSLHPHISNSGLSLCTCRGCLIEALHAANLCKLAFQCPEADMKSIALCFIHSTCASHDALKQTIARRTQPAKANRT